MQKYDCGVSPHGCPNIPMQTGGAESGKSSQNAGQLCAKAEGCDDEDLRADKLWKGWDFQSVPRMLTH